MADQIRYRSRNGTEVWVTHEGHIQSITLDWYEEGGCIECIVMDSARISIYSVGAFFRRAKFSWTCRKCGHHEIEIDEVP